MGLLPSARNGSNHREKGEKMKKKGPMQHLICSCCGAPTLGRQWWNRDTGYGICDDCVDFVQAPRTEGAESSGYGIAGTHYLAEGGKPWKA